MEVLRDWLNTHLGNIVATKFEVDGNNVKAVMTADKYLVEHLTQNKKVEVTPTGVAYTDASDELGGTYTVSITTSGVTITKEDLSATLSKNGLTVTDGTNTLTLNAGSVKSKKFKTTGLVEINADYQGLVSEGGVGHEVGEIAFVANTTSSQLKVYISSMNRTAGNYVNVSAGCCMQFICGYCATAQIEWYPVEHAQIY